MKTSTQDPRLAVIWKDTHRDYKGSWNGEKSIMLLRGGGSVIVPLSQLTESEIASRYADAIRKRPCKI